MSIKNSRMIRNDGDSALTVAFPEDLCYDSEKQTICAVHRTASAAAKGEDVKKKLFSEIPYLKSVRLELRSLTQAAAPGLQELVDSEIVYRYLPTFLFEKKYPDVTTVIECLYDECWKDSIILGVFLDGEFCGLMELYGYRDAIHKVSVGYRLLERCWRKGIASETLGMMVDYLYNETDIEIITASTMVENEASANVLRKNGFQMVIHAVEEDWGYEKPVIADKWIR